MSDTVYEKDGLYVTRYWGGGKGDCVQITFDTGGYRTMTLAEFNKIGKAVNKNVRETKDAWWHNVGNNAED